MARADVNFPRTKITDPNALKQTRIIQPGTAANAFKGVVQQPRQPFEKQQVYKTSRILGIRLGPAYVDSASGTITLSGTSVEAFAVKPPQVLYPKAVEIQQVLRGSRRFVKPQTTYNDTASGTIILSGTATDAFAVVPPKVFYPRAVDVLQVYRGSRLIGTVTAAPIVYTDSASGTITLSGTSSEIFLRAVPKVVSAITQPLLELRKGPVSRIYQALFKSNNYADSATGQITLSGTATDQFSTPGVRTFPIVAGNLTAGPVQAPEQFDDPNFKPFAPAVFEGLYTAPPIYKAILPGTTNQDYSFQAVKQPDPYPIVLGSRFFRMRGNNDFGTGQIVLSGSAAEGFTGNTFSNLRQSDPNHPVYTAIGDR